VNRHSAFFAGAFTLAALFVQSVSVEAADDPDKRAAADAELICLTEQPAIVEGEIATLRAWASTFDGRPIDTLINFKWEVNAGRIEAQAAATKWDLSTVKVGLQLTRKVVATATATQTDGSELRCAVEIFIGRQEATTPNPGPGGNWRGALLSARRYLLPGEVEAPGFGLYSYLLFSAPPKGSEEKARYLKTIEASLLVLQEVDDYLGRHVPPSKLNATYIPVKKAPDRGGSDTQWAENVLAVYDYTAAQILLNRVQQAHRQGPNLLSVLKRPSDAGTSAHLWEDFTGLVPELAWERIRLFTYLAAQERSWSEDSLQRFGLKLRNLIAVGGKVTPDVMKGLEKAIQFKPTV
jgi:hypothetical protein